MNKLGIGIITYNRPDYFKRCIESIPAGDEIVIVNDGDPYPANAYPSKVTHLIQHTENKCVGASKNEALKYLYDKGLNHFFIIEDDMEIIDPGIFTAYIGASKTTGIQHFNYGPGSPWNRVGKDKNGKPTPKMIIDYGKYKIALYMHTVAMFSYFSRKVVGIVGLHDENFHNAWEHVDYTARIAKAGMTTPFWWFADIMDSVNYVREQENALENSSITKDETRWKDNIEKGIQYYMKKYGRHPSDYPQISTDVVLQSLKKLKETYATVR